MFCFFCLDSWFSMVFHFHPESSAKIKHNESSGSALNGKDIQVGHERSRPCHRWRATRDASGQSRRPRLDSCGTSSLAESGNRCGSTGSEIRTACEDLDMRGPPLEVVNGTSRGDCFVHVEKKHPSWQSVWDSMTRGKKRQRRWTSADRNAEACRRNAGCLTGRFPP